MDYLAIWKDIEIRLKNTSPLNQQAIIKTLKTWHHDLLLNAGEADRQLYAVALKKEWLDEYIGLNEDEYDFNPDWEDWETYILNYMFKNIPGSLEDIIIIIRGLMHDLLVFKTQTPCPRCGDDNLRVYADGDHILLSCDRCLFLADQALNKEKVKPVSLKPATKEQLLTAGILRGC